MALPEYSLRQLLEAGAHFGHQTQRWNPKMAQFIYGERNGIHIIDLTQTVQMLDAALQVVRDTVARGGHLLFVGTKRQAKRPVAEAAERCAQYYVNHRWLPGTLTNWKVIESSISRLKGLEDLSTSSQTGLPQKERETLERDRKKLQTALGGIRELDGPPDILFVIDVEKEAGAIQEANKLGIPVVAVVGTNRSPEGVNYIIPGNDDTARSIGLFCDLVALAALDGLRAQSEGSRLGEAEVTAVLDMPTEVPNSISVKVYLDIDDPDEVENLSRSAEKFLEYLGYISEAEIAYAD